MSEAETPGHQAKRHAGATPGVDFQRLFQSVPGLYLVLLPDAPTFTIVAVSDSYANATKTQREAILGRGIFEVFPDNPDDPDASGTQNLSASLHRVIETRTPDSMAVQQYDIQLPESEGGGFEARFWSPLNTPVFGDDGSIAYILHRVENVTEFVQLKRKEAEAVKESERLEQEIYLRAQAIQKANEELRLANEKLGRLDQLKTEFFSNVSHEFRTPLTLLLGPVEALLAADSLSESDRSQLELAHRNALRLLRLVNTLLDFSRIEAGRVDAKYEPVDLGLLTNSLASVFGSAFESAGLEFRVECQTLPEPVWVDRDMWEKIVLNLLSNALKFTFAGSVGVRVEQVEENVRLIVTDSGVGIPEHELPLLFERFHRVEGQRSRTHEGTGIGLSLAQELVHLHGGTIAVDSRLDQGTTFTVTLPLGSNHLPADRLHAAGEPQEVDRDMGGYFEDPLRIGQAAAREQNGRVGALAGRVLLADDNADMRAYVAELLSPFYEVVSVQDGRAALAEISAAMPDLVLSDVMMPNLDGYGLLKSLRSQPETATLPVILLSARAGEGARVEGLDAGADDYLVKPFSAQELIARVGTHIRLSKEREAARVELQLRVDELAEAHREAESFNYYIAHDLRAPLRALVGSSRILLEDFGDKLDGMAKEQLERQARAAKKVSRLVDELLQLSRISRQEMKRLKVDLSELAESIAADLSLRDWPTMPVFSVEPDLVAEGDPNLLHLLLTNLLDNACKYSPDGAEVRFGRQPTPRGSAFFVQDNGIGFDPKYADKVFMPFERLVSERDFPGTGIGLANVKRIAERHGGDVWVDSEPGQGTTFYFTL